MASHSLHVFYSLDIRLIGGIEGDGAERPIHVGSWAGSKLPILLDFRIPPFWEIYIYTHLHIDAHICKKHIIYMSIYVSSISTYFLISNMDGLLWPGHPNLVELLGRRPSRGDWFSWIPMRLQQLDNLWLVVWKDMLRNKMGWIFAGWWFGRWIIFFHLLRKWDL